MEKAKLSHFSGMVVVCDMKVGRRIQPNEYMNLYVFQRSRLYIDLGSRSLRVNVFKFVFLRDFKTDKLYYFI